MTDLVNEIDTGEKMSWRVHTPRLLAEILTNTGTGVLTLPLQIFGNVLAEVAERAIELGDPELDMLMLRLTLYGNSDPSSPDFDKDAFNVLAEQISDQNNNPPKTTQE